MFRNAVAALVAMTAAAAGAERVEVLAVCGASSGYSYFPQDDGWTQDHISNGSIKLIRVGAQYDIIYVDAAGLDVSAHGDGFTVIAMPRRHPTYLTILSAHEVTGVVEHYLFRFDDAGSPVEVVWGTIKGGGSPFPKSSLMRASCHQ